MLTGVKSLIDAAKNHQGFRRYFENSSWMFAEQILRLIAGLLVGIWVARYLGPEQFGVFSYALAFVAIFGSIAKLGLDGIIVRDLVLDPDMRDVYLGTAFWLKFFGALFTLGVVTLTTFFASNDSVTNLYIFIIASGIIFQSFEVVEFYFQSKVLNKFVSLCKISQLLLSSLLKLYFVFTGADLLWFVLVTLVDQIMLGIAFYIAYRYQKLPGIYWKFDLQIAIKLLKQSWPVILSSLCTIIYMRIDQIMLNEILGSRDVGVYSAAVRLSEVWYIIPVIISSSLFPAIVGAKKVSEEFYYARLQRFFTFTVWLAIVITLAMTLVSNWLVTFLYGEAYSEAGNVLLIQIWALVFVFLGVASGKWYLTEGFFKLAFYRTLLAVAVNIILNYMLIPIYGINGAATATVITHILNGFVFDLFSKNTRKIFFMKLNTINISRKFKLR